MTVTADATAFQQEIREHFARVLDDAVADMLAEMERDAPRDTGAMTQTIEIAESDSGDVLARTITAPQEYSSYMDEGTQPHEIRGRPLLAFTASDGSRVIVHSVQHPGTKRTGWWSDPLAKFSEYVAQAMGR